MYKLTTKKTDIDIRKWEAFVKKHPRGTIFQTPGMYSLYEHSLGCLPLFCCVEDGNEIVGLMVAVLYTNGRGLIRAMTCRSIVNGGPLCINDDETVLNLLMTQYQKDVAKRGAIYTEIRNVFDSSRQNEQLKKNGYEYENHLNLILDLTRDIDSLYSRLHKERRRNIRQAENFGLVFKEVKNEDEISKVVEIIEETYRRKSVPMAYSDIFSIAQQELKDRVRFFAAYWEDTMIAGQIRLFYKGLAYAWFAGSKEDFFKKRPNDYLMWNVIVWSKQNGYHQFDFGGGGKPNVPYGVRDYKLKYGCDVYDYGRMKKVHRPLFYVIGKIGYSMIHRNK